MIEQANRRADRALGQEGLNVEGQAGKLRTRRLLILAKVGFTLLAFILVARVIDPQALLDRARRTDPSFFLAAIALSIAQIPLVGLRWRRIVQTMSPDPEKVPGHARFQQITYIAQFFGQVLPFVAGDGLRVLFLHEAGASLRVAFKSTLLDRGIAALTLVALALPSVLLSPALKTTESYRAPILLLVSTALVGAVLSLVAAPLLARVGSRWRATSAVTEALLDLRRILTRDPASLQIVGLCVLVHVISMVVFWMLARGESMPLLAVDAAAIVPVVLLASMIPIVIGGWGVREGLVVTLLGAQGIDPESALLLSVSFGTVLLLAALPGVIVLGLSIRSGGRTPPSLEL